MIKRMLAGSLVLTTALLGGFSLTATSVAQGQEMAEPQVDAPSEVQATEVSDAELTAFVNAVQQLQVLEAQSRGEMAEAIEEEGLSTERYSELVTMQQDPTAETELSAEESAQFEQAMTRVAEIGAAVQSQQEEVLVQEGIEVERFNQILAQVEGDPELLERVQAMLQS